ncbi:MAG: hypothetical protein WA707_22085 [Pseudolabrys sp.]
MSAFGKETSFGLVGMSAFDPKRGGLVSDGARRHNFHYFNKDVMLSAMELLMDEQARSLDKTAIACGLLALAMGLFIVLSAFGIIPSRGSTDGERWIGVIAGMAFVFGGLAVVIQTCARATPGGDLPSTAPIWVRATVRLLSLAIVVSLGAIGTWVAFDPASANSAVRFRSCRLGSTNRSFLGPAAILIWIILIVMAVVGARRLRGPKE